MEKQIDDLENFIINNGYHVTKLEAAQLYVFNLPERIKDLCKRRGYERLENHWIHRKGKSDVAIYRVRKIKRPAQFPSSHLIYR
jgi:hypothetical protein